MTINLDCGYAMTIDGRAVDSERRIVVIDPATEEKFASAPDASAYQLDAAVAAARRALAGWAGTPIGERQTMLTLVAEGLTQHAEAFAQLLTREQGKPLVQARREVGASIAWFNAFARMVPQETIIERMPQHEVKVRRVPIGVVGAIVPWNFPLLLAVWKLAPALVAGNTVVLKPSPFTPLTALKLGELMKQTLPAGVVNVLSGSDALGPWMSAHAGIDKLAFTGSTATGRKVMEAGSRGLKRLTLELGGNDAAIVLPDVDIEEIAQKLFWGAFTNSAQFCLAIKRLYIHEDIYEPLSRALVAYAATVKMGAGTESGCQIGPIQNVVQFDRLMSLLADAREKGLRFLAGGDLPAGRGYFFPVTIVDNPPDDSRVVVEEAFGPILPLLKFRDIDDVIARANASEFGLGASVWSKDVAKAKEIAERLQSGMVWINQIHMLAPHIPLGGHKQSGMGVENGIDGLHEYTHLQVIQIPCETVTS